MRNIASININKIPYELGYANEGNDTNEIILSITMGDLKNPYIEITRQNGTVETEPIISNNYELPITYFYSNGILKVRIFADNYSSEYINFNISDTLNADDNICLKKENDDYIIKKLSYYKYSDLPIATTESLGGIIVGDNLEIDSDGVLSAIGSGSSGSSISIKRW